MALPEDPRTPWPPRRERAVYNEMALHAAWYAGDTARLGQLYGGGMGHRRPSEGGGFFNRISDRFWGRRGVEDPLRGGNQRMQLHVPLAADIATTSADLQFGEPPSFQIPEAVSSSEGSQSETTSEAGRAQDRLEELIELAGLDNVWLEGAELSSALGAHYLRPVWDQDLADYPMLTVIRADEAVPEFSHGILRAVTFWRILETDNNKYIRHLERHEPGGLIFHGLYESSDERTLGRKIALTDHEETKALADSLTDADVIELEGFEGLLVKYVPNIRPSRRHRTHHARSDLQEIEHLMDALDETFTSLMRDIRLGQRRILVAQEYLERIEGKPEEGAWFNIDKEVFTPMGIDPQGMIQGNEKGITPIDFDIRTEQHFNAAIGLRDEAISTAGYSPESFRPVTDGQPESGVARRQRERKSVATTSKKERYSRAPICEALETLLFIDKTIFGNDTPILRPQMSFSDFTAETASERADSARVLREARVASIETSVRMVRPDWSDDEVAAEVQKIREEEGLNVPDVTIEDRV